MCPEGQKCSAVIHRCRLSNVETVNPDDGITCLMSMIALQIRNVEGVSVWIALVTERNVCLCMTVKMVTFVETTPVSRSVIPVAISV